MEIYVSLRGYKHGEVGNGGKKRVQNGLSKITLDEIAKELNMSKRNLQRVLGNTNPVKLGRCFEFLSNYYGFKNGGDRKSESKVFTLKNSDELHNQTELAESYGITKQTMNNYMRMASMIPELEDLVDTGIITTSIAHAINYK